MEDRSAVIFDLDGVLVDTEGATCQWIAQLLEPHGLQWTTELHRHIAGTVKFFPDRCLELLEVPDDRKTELVKVLPSRLTSPEYSNFVAERMEIKVGASALIQRLQSLQIPLALCTSRRGDGLKALMDLREDLADLLEPLKVQVVGAIDPRTGAQMKGKPDPQVYRVCAEILGVEAAHCVVFEDAPSGIYSAKAAGCLTVAVPETWMMGDPMAEEAFAIADLRLKSLEDILQSAGWNQLFGSLPPLLVGFGNPTVDVISVLDDLEAHLQDFGLEPGTEATGLQDAQKLALVDLARRLTKSKVPGGAAMNTLRVARSLGHLRCAFIGAIGSDVEGKIIQEALLDAGVVPLLKKVDLATGVCGVLVDRKTRDRTLAMVRGAAAQLDPEWIERSFVSCLVNEASMVYITSFVLTSQPRIAAAEVLAEKALLQGGRLCLNLSSAGLLRKVKDSLMNLLPKCSFLFGNRGELRAFAELLGWASDTDVEAIRCLATMLPGMAVITAGAEPTMVAVDGDVQLFPVPQVPPETIIDMNGAGDAFVGGFLSQAIVEAPLSDCIRKGQTHKAKRATADISRPILTHP